MAPLEPQAKVLVSKAFLGTTHGELACETCHGGNPASQEKAAAHAGLVALPSVADPQKACGDCHAEIVATAKGSLHASLATFPKVLAKRGGANVAHVEEGRKNHCGACHTSCGGCHVSRPQFAGKGFVAGHAFQKRSDPIEQCTACHGSRVGFEYYGERGQGDVHAAKGMDCVACHGANELHAAAPKDLAGRYQLKQLPRCTGCHEDLEHGSVREHAIHAGRVACQLCHAQTYVNCYECHVGKDPEGTAYFQNKREVETFKIGLASDKAVPGQRYALVRHVPAFPEMFDFYGKGGFTSFGAVPTWKRASPHNIQRRTWQAATCNNCHGNRALFLSAADLLPYEKQANAKVVVADAKVPKAIAKTRRVVVDTSKVRAGMVVSAGWVKANAGKGDVVVVDVRGRDAYAKGHVPGAVSLDPATAGFRSGPTADRPFTLAEHATVAGILGKAGLAANDRVVVYDQTGAMAAAFLALLEWAGAKNVSYLDGGIEGWHAAGLHTATEPTVREARAFGGTVQAALVVSSDELAKLLGQPDVIVLDTRSIHRTLGETRHEKAARAGRIPGSVNLPATAFIMDNGALKPPEELLWMLRIRGITPDKLVVTTCDTGIGAADTYFMLRWLGFPKVRVHEEAWVVWSRTH